tara:strand:+ start:8803 stop:9381 length:579 start_codon:yes stop_codon:yes gene_type:complete
MSLLDRNVRRLINTKQDSLEFKGVPSSNSLLDGQTAVQKESNSQLAIYRKKFGKIWKSYMSSNGNQFVDRDLIIGGKVKSRVTVEDLVFKQGSEKTIVETGGRGSISISDSYHIVDTQSDASSDNLDEIQGGEAGQILILRTANSSRDVVVRHDEGNIFTASGSNVTLGTTNSFIILLRISTGWYEIISRSY